MPNHNILSNYNFTMISIKKTFYLLIAFFLFFHFIAPGVYFSIFGYFPTYQGQYHDPSSIIKGFMLNLLSGILGALLIHLTPSKGKTDIKEFNFHSKFYLIFAIIFSFGSTITIGNFETGLRGLHPPSGFFIFGNMLINLDYYFLFALAFTNDFIMGSQIIYVLKSAFAASRSASLSLFLFILYSLWRPNIVRILKRYLFYFIFALSMAIFSFRWATNIRSQDVAKGSTFSEKLAHTFIGTTSKSDSGYSYFALNHYDTLKKIIARASFLETTMLPIIYKDRKLPNLKIFYEGYSITNQLKLIVNNLLPGDVFPPDVMPNQYYRAAFLNMPVKLAREYYTSINMTLPVYFYMYFSFALSIIITGLAIWAYYMTTTQVIKLHPILGSVFIYYFYSYFLSFFDFVSIVKMLAVGIIAIPIFIIFSKIEGYILKFIFKTNPTPQEGL